MNSNHKYTSLSIQWHLQIQQRACWSHWTDGQFSGRITTRILRFIQIYLFISWRPFRKSTTSIPSLHIDSFYEFPKTASVAATIGYSQSMCLIISKRYTHKSGWTLIIYLLSGSLILWASKSFKNDSLARCPSGEPRPLACWKWTRRRISHGGWTRGYKCINQYVRIQEKGSC